ncbi:MULTISPECIES: hypothetical protein [Rummeliibacillus]|uniref:hypothetical protein n=1 Tax=Rummeliibacillus TaxID=648802 RepID=UPI00123A3584|nr:hypothetical protein [Rummeliibacillus sp. TYF-LIM-RU47]
MKKLLIATLSVSLLLSACGVSVENKKETTIDVKDNNILSKYGDVKEYYNKQDLSYKISTGPMKLEITGINVADLAPNKESEFIFDNLKKAHVLILNLNTKNTSNKEVWFSADHPTLVTNTGEQVDVRAHEISKTVGEDFKGKVSKEGRIVFFLEKEIKDIKKITLYFDSPVDKNKEPIGEKTKIVISLK